MEWIDEAIKWKRQYAKVFDAYERMEKERDTALHDRNEAESETDRFQKERDEARAEVEESRQAMVLIRQVHEEDRTRLLARIAELEKEIEGWEQTI